MNTNWKTATKADRAALYQVARAISDTTEMTVEAIMEQAFGHKLMVGTDYKSNFRGGAIGRPKAKLIHAWIAEHHAETAHAIDPELFPKVHTNAWEDYLENHAIKGKLRIVRFDNSMGLVQRKRDQPSPDEVIKLGEEFCFELDSDIAGYAVGFQMYKGTMHPFPLGLDGELNTPIQCGAQFVPLDDNGNPEKLIEANGLGLHRFIIAVAKDQDKLPTPKQAGSPNTNISVYVLKVEFFV